MDLDFTNEGDRGLRRWECLPFLQARKPELDFTQAKPPPLYLYEPHFTRPIDLVEDPDSYRILLPYWRSLVRRPAHMPPSHLQTSRVSTLLARFDKLPILKAVADDDLDGLRRAIEERDGGLVQPETGETALHIAAACARPKLLELLLDKGLYDSVNVCDKPGRATPLMYLAWHSAEPCRTGRVAEADVAECFRLLLRHRTLLEAVSDPEAGNHSTLANLELAATGWAARAWNSSFLRAFRSIPGLAFATPSPAGLKTAPVSEETERLILEKGWLRRGHGDPETWEERRALEAECESMMHHVYDDKHLYYWWRNHYLRHALSAFGPMYCASSGDDGQDDDLAAVTDDDDDDEGLDADAGFYSWDFSGSRLVLGSQRSNSAWSQAHLDCWKATVDELILGGVKIDPMRDMVNPMLTHVPAEAALHLLDHLLAATRRPVDEAAAAAAAAAAAPARPPHVLFWPIFQSVPRGGVSDQGALAAMWVLLRPWNPDLPQLLDGLAARGVDFADPKFTVLWPEDRWSPAARLVGSAKRRAELTVDFSDRREFGKFYFSPLPIMAVAIGAGRVETVRKLIELGAEEAGRPLLFPGLAWPHFLDPRMPPPPSWDPNGEAWRGSLHDFWLGSIVGAHDAIRVAILPFMRSTRERASRGELEALVAGLNEART